jgi:D-amino-acid dehydrogenase
MGEIVVIGAGVVGMACARALQRVGKSVRVIDRQAPGKGCSYGNAGHIAIDHVRPLARMDILAKVPGMLFNQLAPLCLRWSALPQMLPWFLRFAFAARPSQVARGTAALGDLLGRATDAWRDELRECGASDLLISNGHIAVYENPRSRAATRLDIMRAHGVRVDELSGDQAREMVPGLTPKVMNAAYFPDASHVVNPYRVVVALAEAFTRAGGAIVEDEVVDFARADGAVQAVVTRNGRWPADQVVLAGGCETVDLARKLGAKVPTAAERGYHMMVVDSNLKLTMLVAAADRSFAITPLDAGVRLAGTVEFAGRDGAPNWRRAEILFEQLKQVFPGFQGKAGERWFGHRPTLPDFLPAIGALGGVPNAYVATGHQHLGLTLAAVTGRLIADMATGRANADYQPALSPARFG